MAGKHEESASDPSGQEVLQLMERIAAHDHAIDAMEAELRALPGALAELAGHPVLWLLLGREGIDRRAARGAPWSASRSPRCAAATPGFWCWSRCSRS